MVRSTASEAGAALFLPHPDPAVVRVEPVRQGGICRRQSLRRGLAKLQALGWPGECLPRFAGIAPVGAQWVDRAVAPPSCAAGVDGIRMTMDALMITFAGGLFMLLIAVLAWIGQRVHSRLDRLSEMLDEKLTTMSGTLAGIERDLRGDITALDRRISHLEGKNGQ